MENTNDVRKRLISEGIRILSDEGSEKLSLRRVAQSCGVSCAAPYKHFRDKTDFILCVVDTVNQEWFDRQAQALNSLGNDVDEQLRIVCKEYLRFLWEHPSFCAIITQRDESTGKWHIHRLFDQSTLTQKLIRQYAEKYKLSTDETFRRTYVIRAIIYGAAMMTQLDGMQLDEGTLLSLYAAIDAQFVNSST